MKKRWIQKITALLLTGCCLLSGVGEMEPEKVNAQTEESIPDGMKLVTENTELELYLDEASTAIAVRVKETGDVWYSNPPAAGEDSIASSYHQNLMRSQFSIQYYNENAQSSEMDNYNDSIANGQFEITYTSDGVSIFYQLGELADKYILPQVISEERFTQYLDQMDKDAAKKTKRVYTYLNKDEMKEADYKAYLELYPTLEQYNLYVLQEGTKDYKKEEIMGYFLEVGYTAEDMAQDNADNGFEAANEKPWFNITLEYKLDGDNLVAQIDPTKVEYNTESYYLVDIDLLEFFGAAASEEEGYLFVPDGSGALIYLNNQKTTAAAYIASVYGQDITNSYNSRKESEIDQAVTVRMPVFGLKSGDKAWFAIIEGAAERANVNAEVAGRTNSYNNVYAGFTYLSYGEISLGDVVGSQTFQMYSPAEFTENFSVRYAFLHGEEADYTGMAHYYQDYLVEQGAFTKQEQSDEIPLYLNLIGAIEKTKSVFGIKYNATQSLTTYAQAVRIVEELEQAGVGGIKVQYQGWSRGGLHGTAPKAVKALSALNSGGVNLKEFLQKMSAKGIQVFHSAELQFVYDQCLGDGYTPSSDAPQYYDKSTVRTGEYLIPNGYQPERDINMISPYIVTSMAKTFLKKVSSYKLAGISVNSLATELYSDFSNEQYADRTMAAEYNAEAIKMLGESVNGNVLANNANAYSFAWLSDIIEVPFDSNRAQIIDESIPFYAIVLHGYKDFAGPALNLADDYTTTVLQSIECGAGLSFQWIYESNSLLKDTDFDYLYSVNYGVWKEDAIQTWKRVNDAVGSVQGQRILEHEKLATGVYATTYEDGTKVIVNYGNEAVTVAGTKVNAKDFAVVKER